MDCFIANKNNKVVNEFIKLLEEKSEELKLEDSVLYYNYPFFRDDEGELIEPNILLISKYGIFIIWVIVDVRIDSNTQIEINETIEQLVYILQSKLMVNRALRGFKDKIFNYVVDPIIYAPLLSKDIISDYKILKNSDSIILELQKLINNTDIFKDVEYQELRATIEGTKSLIKKKKRVITSTNSKGNRIDELEKEIALFDRNQRIIVSNQIEGPTRIRGLAGSGKTIILTMKAALIHLHDQNAEIIYTFWTKSLYQQIRTWITKFYSQYSNGEKPNWDKIHVLHGWGSKQKDGVYRNTCISNGIRPLSFLDLKEYLNPFDIACKRVMKETKLQPKYDFILIDEGQDFPASFIQLCMKLVKENKFVLAYDDQQSIFQRQAPSPGDIFGYDEHGNPNSSFSLDLVLYKVYRNPREVLVCAQALGFGIYGEKMVQVIEDMDFWGDIGYIVKEGEAASGSIIKVERPEKNSLPFISEKYSPEEIIKVEVCQNLDDELKRLVQLIKGDIFDENLNPDDILVIAVNDFSAKYVLKELSNALEEEGITTNNIHSDPFNIMNFFKKNEITLSTIHKAKGNEAYSVYIIGVDFLFHNPTLIKRNRLFTAITRSKAWVTLIGVGKYAEQCQKEINDALSNFPYLIFKFPSEEEIKKIKRELSFDSELKIKRFKLLGELMAKYGSEFSDEELEGIVQDFIAARKENE